MEATYIPPGSEMMPSVPQELMADPGANPITNEQVADPMMDDTPIRLPSIMAEDGRGIELSIPLQQPQQQTPSAPQEVAGNPTMPMGGGQQQPQQQPQQQAGQGRARRAGSPMGLGFNPDYRYTQEDFYGKQRDITWTDPRGVQMYVPTAGKLPMSIAASVLQNTQSQMQRVQAAKMKLLQPPDIKTADPYQSSFNNMLGDMRNDWIQSKAEMYGSEDQVWREVVNNPQMAQEWAMLHKDAEAVAQSGKWAWDEAKGYIDRSSTGKYFVDPEVRKRAEEVYYGLGNLKGSDGLPNVRKLLSNIEAFGNDISRDQFLKDYVLPQVQKMYQKGSTPVEYMKNGRIARFQWNNTESLPDDFYDYLADQYASLSPADEKEKAKEYFRKIIPQMHVEGQLQTRSIPSSKGKGDGSKRETGVTQKAVYGPVEGTDPGSQYNQVRVSKIGAGTGSFMPPSPFVGDGGKPTTMHPIAVYRDPTRDGELRIVGKLGADPRARVKARQTDEGSVTYSLLDESGGETAIDEATYFDNLPTVNLPYEGANESAFELSTGLGRDQIETEISKSEQVRKGRDEKLMSGMKRGSAPTSGKKTIPGF